MNSPLIFLGVQLTPMLDCIALFYFLMYSIRSIALAWTAVAQDIYTHKHTHLQNTSHVYSALAALILCPILLKHYCTIKYIVNQIKNANK